MEKKFIIKDMHDYFDVLSEHFNGSKVELDSEQQIFLPPAMGRGMIRRMQIKKGLEIVISDLELAKNMNLKIKDTCGIFELNYCLSGEAICGWGDRHIHVKRQTGNICYLEHAQVHIERQSGVRNYALEIRMQPQVFCDYFPSLQDRKVLENILRCHHKRIETYHMSPAIQKCVYELVGCSHQGSAKRIYLHGKVLELLSMFIQEHVNGSESEHSNLCLSKSDIFKLHEARKFVLEHLDNPFSIKELSRHVGINQTKLKNGFRKLFGTTIFGLIRSQRMDKAIRLMKIDRMNVSETASVLGYSNMSNFSAAFRKKFGCNPSEYLISIRNDCAAGMDNPE